MNTSATVAEPSFVGVDISKDTFDACIQERIHTFAQTEAGFAAFVHLLPASAQVVLEATGNYGARLCLFLHQAGIKVWLLNPLQTKRFAQSQLLRAKTDRSDAALITQFAAVSQLSAYEPPSAESSELEQLQALRDQLLKQHTALINQLHALDLLPTHLQSDAAKKALRQTLKHLEKAIEKLDDELSRLARSAYGQKLEQLVSIPGIGEKTAIRLLAHTRQMSRFKSDKELVAFFGLCPRWSQSGTSLLASGSICKTGNSSVRTAFYMCAIAAIRANPACKNLYARLRAKGKKTKVALIAVANKLLRQCFAVISKNMSFDLTLSLNL